MLKTKLLGATAAAGELLAIEDVFSIYFHNGTSATQTITNGIDLAGEGGLVWIKSRTAARAHMLFDTERGVHKYLMSQSTNAEATASTSLTAFNANGFTLGSDSTGDVNYTGNGGYASWTFRKAPRFFDVVTWSGNSTSGRAIPHNLGTTPGMIIVKWYDGSQNWAVWHKDLTAGTFLLLNQTNAVVTNSNVFTTTSPTDSVFYVGSDYATNGTSANYVAYLFAHDPLGPSGDGSDGLIACGSFATTGADVSINLGWEPQWLLVKRATGASDWTIWDEMRGLSQTATAELVANGSSAETVGTSIYRPIPTATGFIAKNSIGYGSGETLIYIAIRRGPMREPTSGTEVFHPLVSSSAEGTQITTGFPVDAQIIQYTLGNGPEWIDRLRGVSTTNTSISTKYLYSASTAAETTGTNSRDWGNTGYDIPARWAGSSTAYWSFRRAPGFFDVVAYTGTGAARTVTHNLGVAPQLIVVKRRNSTASWYTYNETIGAANALALNTTVASFSSTASWNSTSPTSTVFTVNTENAVNGSGSTYVAYLFATLTGVSKVGSYTGNGSSQTINCSFTGGARFVLIKRTDSTGDWYVWDTARGIVSGNDPHLSLNTTAAQVTTDDTIDPDSSGFIVNQVAATNVNVSSASYIYLAIA